jgi:hypothetical protein
MCFVSCDKNKSASLTAPVEPEFTIDPGPSFPAFAVHILEREHVHQKSLDNQRAMRMTQAEYVESRLRDLYPNVAYHGMLDRTSAAYEQYVKEYEQYVKQEALYEASIGLEPEPEEEPVPFTTLEDEIERSGMSQEEVDLFLELEQIAQSDIPVTSESLENLLNADGGRLRQQFIPWFGVNYISSMMPYAAFRIYLGHKRATDKAKDYYGIHTTKGKRGDAFKHIFMSMYLRRFIGRSAAYVAMYLNELRRDWDGSNDPPNREMDLHNNTIGLKTKYGHFRAHWFWDVYNWRKWSRRVRDYVNKHSNGVKMEKWDDDAENLYPESNSVAQDEANTISNKKYIWFRENSEN